MLNDLATVEQHCEIDGSASFYHNQRTGRMGGCEAAQPPEVSAPRHQNFFKPFLLQSGDVSTDAGVNLHSLIGVGVSRSLAIMG